jgi:hypothetical protein
MIKYCDECLELAEVIKVTDRLNFFYLCKECIEENGFYFEGVKL